MAPSKKRDRAYSVRFGPQYVSQLFSILRYLLLAREHTAKGLIQIKVRVLRL
jgi:hypothetical protein